MIFFELFIIIIKYSIIFIKHSDSIKDWSLSYDLTVKSKFHGHYIEIEPIGAIHLHFKKNNTHYTWNQANAYAHGILVGKIWVSVQGEYSIVNHLKNEVCQVKFHQPPALFSKERLHRVTSLVRDSNNLVRHVIEGEYSNKLECSNVLNPKCISSFDEVNEFNLGPSKLIWKRDIPP